MLNLIPDRSIALTSIWVLKFTYFFLSSILYSDNILRRRIYRIITFEICYDINIADIKITTIESRMEKKILITSNTSHDLTRCDIITIF